MGKRQDLPTTRLPSTGLPVAVALTQAEPTVLSLSCSPQLASIMVLRHLSRGCQGSRHVAQCLEQGCWVLWCPEGTI